jgi:plastocyanin
MFVYERLRRGAAVVMVAVGLGAAWTAMNPAAMDAWGAAGNSQVRGEAATVPPVLQDVYVIEIESLRFRPDTLVVPAGKKIKLEIRNLDRTPEEFESYDLNREKVVMGRGTIKVFVGPLKAGTYRFFGDFHQDTAQGVIVAR